MFYGSRLQSRRYVVLLCTLLLFDLYVWPFAVVRGVGCGLNQAVSCKPHRSTAKRTYTLAWHMWQLVAQ